jgi:hypothetical protein
MNSPFQDGILAAIYDLELDTQGTVTWAGQTYPCAGGVEFSKQLLTEGGFKLSADVQIMVRASLFAGGAQPADKQTIIYVSGPGSPPNRLKIDCVDQFYGVALLLNCNHVAQGA